MVIEQQKFFEGLELKECEFEYGNTKRKCYKGSDGGFYRVDHFGKCYVIEFAENEDEAKSNFFEDSELYDDSLPEDKLIRMIQEELLRYSNSENV